MLAGVSVRNSETNKCVFCCNVAKRGIEHDHLRAAVFIRNQMRRFCLASVLHNCVRSWSRAGIYVVFW